MTAATVQIYGSSAEQLFAEFRWLERLIERELRRFRGHATGKGAQDLFHGMYISDQQIDRLMAQGSPERASSIPPQDNAEALREELDQRRAASLQAGVPLALSRLSSLFALSTLEEHIVLAALAPEVDGKFGTLYAYLQDEFTRRRPSIDLALRLLCASPGEQLNSLKVFSHQAPLYAMRILRPPDKPADDPLRQRSLVLDEPIVDFLLNTDSLEVNLAACLQVVPVVRLLDQLRWSGSLKQQLSALIHGFLQASSPANAQLSLHFHGPRGTGKRTLAAALCREVGIPLLCVDVSEVIARFDDFEVGLRVLFRQGILSRAALFLDNLDCLAGDDERNTSRRKSIWRALRELSSLCFLATSEAGAPRDLLPSSHCISVELPAPDLSQRHELWRSLAAERAADDVQFSPLVNWPELTVKFRVTPGQMTAALDTAVGLGRLRSPGESVVCADDLHRGLYSQSNTKLATLARKLTTRFSWSDIVLPPNALAQLHELCSQVKHRQTVYTDWGFDHKLSLGKGLCALLCGQSGVGKTMAVEIIARELQLEVFKIDLSNVVSKYIGETEKNLSRIFHEAESSNAILFFDEADALFGKRSEIKDAHDRYANIEINYLLQRVEEFEGLVILATNLRKNIDEAFFRRMQFVVEFPFPDASHRYRIWRQHFPPEAPAADDIDLSYLAAKFNVSGGNIKNIVVNAAFLAAEDGRIIRMEHLIRATKREYEKIGRLCTDNEFAPYHTMLATTGGAR
jgi:SpoVK/Ycf46/Vps4 family AAA+-type ATPase